MNPRIIKLASGEAIYANADLIKFIKQSIAVSSDSIKPEDSIYFFKDVEFKRERLNVSKETFYRVIKMEKATAIVVNAHIEFPHHSFSLKDNKIDSNCPWEEADDVIFNVSARGANYLEVIKQWYTLSQLVNKPRVIFEDEILKYINSGVIINEQNYTFVLDMLSSDYKMAANIMDSCDIEQSFPYILSLLYFKNQYLTLDTTLYNNCPNVKRYLIQKSIGNNLPDKYVYEIMVIEYLKDRITASLLTQVEDKIKGIFGIAQKHVENINIDFKWKKA